MIIAMPCLCFIIIYLRLDTLLTFIGYESALNTSYISAKVLPFVSGKYHAIYTALMKQYAENSQNGESGPVISVII
jgi:hypothetical protein